MKRSLTTVLSFVMIAWVLAAGSLAFIMATNPATASAASGADMVEKCRHGFLGLKPWYQYMGDSLNDGTTADNPGKSADDAKKSLCDVRCFNVFTLGDGKQNECGNSSSDVPLVLLAIVDDLLRIAGLVALGFIFVGSFKYVGSQGNPESTKSAQETIINALLGLAIALTAVAIVSFIGNKLGS